MAEPDFEELLRSFNKHRVRYCVVGGYAVAFHAIPRYTKDMDILIEPSLENGRRVIQALTTFGFGGLHLQPEDFAMPGRVIQLGYEPLRVDLVTSIEHCTFEQVSKHRVRGKYGNQPTAFIGREELIRNKTSVGRPQDEADVKMLRSKRKAGRKRPSK